MLTSTESLDADVVVLGRAMRRLARQLTADHSAADDVVQDAWVTAIARPPAPRGSLRAWLLRVVRSRAVDFERSAERRAARERGAARGEQDQEADAADRFMVQGDVLAAVRALREPYREAVYLRYWVGLGPARIAARLGVQTKTVKTRLTRALAMLRESLDEYRPRREWALALAPIAHGGTGMLASWFGGVLAMQAKKVAVCTAVLVLAAGVWTFWPADTQGDPVVTLADSRSAAAGEPSGLATADGSKVGRRIVASTQPAASGSESHGALRVLTRWHDGTAAPGIAIVFRAEAEPAKERDTTRVITDAAGIALERRLHAGAVAVESDRGGKLATEVVAGAQREVEFVMPEGIEVRGIVVDAERLPVAAAAIWLTTGGVDWLGGRVVSSSNRDGTFLVRAVAKTQSLGALADGWMPSELVDLDEVDLARPIELMILRRGARVQGRVTDDAGNAVAGALVAVGRLGRSPGRHDGTRREGWSPLVTETDQDGRFACATVTPGTVPISVRADGFPLWSAQKTCREGGTTNVDVLLRRAATIHGVVTSDQGSPLAGARVLALDAPIDDLAFDLEVRLSQSAFGRPTAFSDAKGCYTLPFVLPGQVRLLAYRGHGSTRDYQGRDEASLQVAAGDTVRWNPRISLGLVLRGRVEAAGGGRPPFYWPIQATPERAGSRVLTDIRSTQGRFEFTNCDDVPYTITLGDLSGKKAPVRKTGVRPGGQEVVITVPREAEPLTPASVHGRVLDSGRRLASPSALSVKLQSEPQRSSLAAAVEGDRFMAAKIEPGRYRVAVYANDAVVHVGECFDLAPGEDRDLGVVQTVTGGGIVVRTVCRNGAALCQPSVSARDGLMWRKLAWDGKVWRGAGLSPGLQTVTMLAEGSLIPPKEVEVVAEEVREVELEVFPGIRVPFELQAPTQSDWQRLEVRAVDSRGHTLWKWDMPNRTNTTWPFRHAVTLSTGTFTLEAETDNGMRFRRELDLRDLSAELEPINIVLSP